MSQGRWGWDRLFLVERPSIALSAFRVVVALTIGLHVFPAFMQIEDNFLAGSLKSLNASFFPVSLLTVVQSCSDSIVRLMVGVFCLSWLGMLLGMLTQISTWLLLASCYFFYALNCFYIGTLSWDILMVTLVLMAVTPYPGDYFSLDSLFRRDERPFLRVRPYAIQRLLQIQIASTYFFTGLHKISVHGNWLNDNPLYYLMHYPPQGVTKMFLFRDWLAQHPDVCYVMGLGVVGMEILMPFLLWCQGTRKWAIGCAWVFHILLILMFDVPSIFFFLFPAQLLLFIDPQVWLDGLKRRSALWSLQAKLQVLYDGQCPLCLMIKSKLMSLDLTGRLIFVDVRQVDVANLDPRLNSEMVLSQMHLLEGENIWTGFKAFRRLCTVLPMLWPIWPWMHLPGMGFLGGVIYGWVARHRFRFFPRVCQTDCKIG